MVSTIKKQGAEIERTGGPIVDGVGREGHFDDGVFWIRLENEKELWEGWGEEQFWLKKQDMQRPCGRTSLAYLSS